MEQKDICDNRLASLIAMLPNRTADMPDAYPRDWPEWSPYEDSLGGGDRWDKNLRNYPFNKPIENGRVGG